MKATLIKQEMDRYSTVRCHNKIHTTRDWNNTIKSTLIGYNKFGRHVTITIEETGDNTNTIGQHLNHNTEIEVEISFTTKQRHTI